MQRNLPAFPFGYCTIRHNKAQSRPQWSNVLVYLGVKEIKCRYHQLIVKVAYSVGTFHCGRISPMTVLWPKTSKIFQIKGEIHLNFLKLEVVHAVGPLQDRRRVLSINKTRWIDKKNRLFNFAPAARFARRIFFVLANKNRYRISIDLIDINRQVVSGSVDWYRQSITHRKISLYFIDCYHLAKIDNSCHQEYLLLSILKRNR